MVLHGDLSFVMLLGVLYFHSQASYEKPVVVNKWDTSAVKNALDDAVKKVG